MLEARARGTSNRSTRARTPSARRRRSRPPRRRVPQRRGTPSGAASAGAALWSACRYCARLGPSLGTNLAAARSSAGRTGRPRARLRNSRIAPGESSLLGRGFVSFRAWVGGGRWFLTSVRAVRRLGPASRPFRQHRRLRRVDDRPGRERVSVEHLAGAHRRVGTAAPVHDRRASRHDRALVSRRQPARVHLVPQGEGAGAAVRDPRGRRRADTTHRAERGRGRARLVPRRDADRVPRRGLATRRGEEEDGRKRRPRRIDRLHYKLDNEGWTVDRRTQLFVVPVDGSASRVGSRTVTTRTRRPPGRPTAVASPSSPPAGRTGIRRSSRTSSWSTPQAATRSS